MKQQLHTCPQYLYHFGQMHPAIQKSQAYLCIRKEPGAGVDEYVLKQSWWLIWLFNIRPEHNYTEKYIKYSIPKVMWYPYK